jgi:hypothetical protein
VDRGLLTNVHVVVNQDALRAADSTNADNPDRKVRLTFLPG